MFAFQQICLISVSLNINIKIIETNCTYIWKLTLLILGKIKTTMKLGDNFTYLHVYKT